MNYLVTGGAGFLGSHLVDKLLEEDKENLVTIIVVDDFSMGKRGNLPFDPRLTVHKASILDPDIGKYFENIDVVFHLAALTRPQWSIEYPEETNKVNVEGTVRVFLHARDNGVKRTVFASSSSLYGDNVCPTPEDVIPNPMSPYALQKLIGEQYAQLFEKIYSQEINCIRPFNIYGTRQNPKGSYAAAVPNFISYLIRGETPWITGDGEQSRDFIYVDDVVELMILMSKCKEHGESFNAGSGKAVSINELYWTIASIMDKNVKPTYVPKVLEPDKTLADMSKVKRILNWKPKIDLVEGLQRTIEGTLDETKNRG